MNESPQRDELEALLQGWFRRQQTSQDQQALEGRIIDSWQQEQDATEHPAPASPVSPSRHSLRYGLTWFALGAAAAVLVAVFVYPRPQDKPVAVAPPGPPEAAWIAAGQRVEKIQLLEELERLFEDRLAWIAETPEGVQLEIRDSSSAGDSASASLAVRVVVARRTADTSQWTPVWTADLVVREEQTVHFSPTSGDGMHGTELSLWAYRVDHNVVAVDSTLHLGLLAHQSAHSAAQVSGVPMPVTSFHHDGAEYQIFQTVAILEREA